VVLGTGLKRPLVLDAGGNPVLKKRQRTNARAIELSAKDGDESSWDGFASASELEEDSVLPPSQIFSLGIQTESGNSKLHSEAPQSQEVSKSDHADFKAWATRQINEARDFSPNTATIVMLTTPHGKSLEPRKPRAPESDPLPPELALKINNPDRKAHSVQVVRSDEVQGARLKLPIVAEEQKIMEAIHNNPTVIICGATGSGKTTQVPQFLYEAGYGNLDSPTPGMIGITQPRRVAAVTMARRVGEELGNASNKVSYQIRFDSTVGKGTAIKFMTDGILIREVANDFALTKYSAIIIDEAHERSANTDILIGIVSRIVDLRASMSATNPDIRPLKLIIMSATLMIESFTSNQNLFRTGLPPLVQSEGRQYPVTNHFARKTQRDYLEEMFLKVSRGHRKLPPGAMLVFLTGQNEITALAKRLNQAFPTETKPPSEGPRVRISASEAPLKTEDLEIEDNDQTDEYLSEADEVAKDFDEDKEFDIDDKTAASSSILVLSLYSQLPTKEQLRVFEPPPENTRLIVLATNVAETSITIPGIRYVFDCGRSKEKKYDQATGVQSFEVSWISKASAAQRAGRAGRTGPGHCYRLYSSAVYERDFLEHAEPEILRMPVEGVVLQLKSMDLQHVVNFPFPTPPDRQSLAKAEKLLTYLGAIDVAGKITSLGRELSIYPLSPRFAKMLVIGHQHDCIYLTVAMVTAMVIPDLFIPQNQLDLSAVERTPGDVYTNAHQADDEERASRRQAYNKAHHFFSAISATSDACKLLSAFCAYAWARRTETPSSFCSRMFLREKALQEAFQLYTQLLSIVSLNRPGLLDPQRGPLPRATPTQTKALNQFVAASFIDQIAIRADLAPTPPAFPAPKRAIDVPYLPLFPSHTGRVVDTASAAVYIHPSSVLSHIAPAALPQYLVYSRLQRAASSTINATALPKVRMHPLASVTGKQIAALARGTPLLEYGKPVGKVEVLGRERVCWVVPSLVGGEGMGWPLPPAKVRQGRERGGWVVRELVD
jgi:ATP-dependent RNA helicase DHX37/DHR1